MSSPLLKDVFDIPVSTGAEDYVLRLTDATSGAGVGEAIHEYVVTPSLAQAFNDAFGQVDQALSTGRNTGAFLAGSFGSGKSHFMAVLHALLRHDPEARGIRELHDVLAQRDPMLQGKRFFPLAVHFLDGRSMEQVIFDGYVNQVRELHPDAPLPAVFATDTLLEDAENLRRRMGDRVFLAGLNGEDGEGGPQAPSGETDIWGGLLGSNTWTLERYQRSLAAAPGSQDRQDLVSALQSQYFPNYHRMGEHVSMDEGLRAISTHAQQLGYDAVVMFLDELVLWLAFQMNDAGAFGRESQKITKLIEGNYGRLPVPLVSFIARQMDMKRWFADRGADGNKQQAMDDSFRHQEGRFAVIELGDDNLAHVAARRLLQPKDEQARKAIEDAFAGIDRSEGVWDVLLDGMNTDQTNRGASAEAFRLTYPFSPALVSTLRHLSAVMQRDRTALKVMQQMLVDRRDTMTIDEVIPVGDVYDYVVAEREGSVLDPRRAALFRAADTLYAEKLKPALMSALGVAEADLEDGDSDRARKFRMDQRLAHTLLLSAVAPGVPALKELTPARLASLNHGSIVSPLPGNEASLALSKVNQWKGRVPEIHTTGPDRQPVVSVVLSDVDYQSILDNAKAEDNPGRRREMLQTLFRELLGRELGQAEIDGTHRVQVQWRGTHRRVDLLFGNVRNTQEMPGDRFRAAPGTWKLVVDLPFDEPGHSVEEDIRRIEDLTAGGMQERTMIWLPRFLTKGTQLQLQKLVVLDWLLTGHGDRWRQYSDHLSDADRTQAKVILEGQHATLRKELSTAITQAYGALPASSSLVQTDGTDTVLWSLDIQAQAPTSLGGPTLAQAFDQIVAAAWDQTYPEHPRFAPDGGVFRASDLKNLLAHVERAMAHPDHRVEIEAQFATLRMLSEGLRIGKTSETHFVFGPGFFTDWNNTITRGMGRSGLGADDTVTVGQVKDIIRGTDLGEGLEEQMVDTVVIAWTLLDQRAWYHYQAPTPQPAPGKTDRAMELRPQEMPNDDEWDAAVRRAGAIFGLTTTAYKSAGNVTALAHEVHEKAAQLNQPAQQLLQAVGAANEHRALAETPRLTAAREGGTLVESLRTLGGLPLLRHLAGTELRTGERELGRSLITAQAVAGHLRATAWDRLQPLAQAAGDGSDRGREAQRILQSFDEALADQEFARPLEAALKKLESDAWAWVSKRIDPPVPPKPAVPGKKSGRRRVTVTSGGVDFSDLQGEITENLQDGAAVEITWREL
ncbi:DUF6079 family protein [Micrococcus terreus]|uniref:Phage resistance protein n=1 Tax=Micrococcus terreus TaxID=574650 RepID=A0A1I7MJ11_9MICC|nr:DUF6079 family protein [Micrococcus terreus]SFV21876.1 hypothetical protein SAMN04487966_10388 [Micrococcus terreus]